MNWVRKSWDHPNSSKQLAQLCFRKRVWCQRLHWSSWPINSLTELLPYLIASCFTVLAWMRSPEIAWLLAPLPRLFACWLRLDCIVWQWIHHSLFVPEQCHLKMQNFTIEQSVMSRDSTANRQDRKRKRLNLRGLWNGLISGYWRAPFFFRF